MSSWLKTNLKKTSATNLRPEEMARSTTPTPGNLHPDDGYGKKTGSRSGLLAIRVLWAEGLSVPYGTALPPAVQNALFSQQAKLAASVSPSSVTQQRLAKKGNRCVGLCIAYFPHRQRHPQG
jgi:serum/glucocorticoid-regulated kinase 2